MWVHWAMKIMRFQHKGSSIKLQGIKASVNKCTAISAGKLKVLMRRRAIIHCVQLVTTRNLGYDANPPDSGEEVYQLDALSTEGLPATI